MTESSGVLIVVERLWTRHLKAEDYDEIIGVVDYWWGGRRMASMLPRLFFTLFNTTSFAVEHEGRCVAFLVGFISQTDPAQGYVHFVGVAPDYRGRNIGRQLYERFFDVVSEKGVKTVRAITSPVNTGSIAFHKRLGFTTIRFGPEQETEIYKDYDGPGEDRVVLQLVLRKR